MSHSSLHQGCSWGPSWGIHSSWGHLPLEAPVGLEEEDDVPWGQGDPEELENMMERVASSLAYSAKEREGSRGVLTQCTVSEERVLTRLKEKQTKMIACWLVCNFYMTTIRVTQVKCLSYTFVSTGKFFWEAFFQKLCILNLFSLLEGLLTSGRLSSKILKGVLLRCQLHGTQSVKDTIHNYEYIMKCHLREYNSFRIHTWLMTDHHTFVIAWMLIHSYVYAQCKNNFCNLCKWDSILAAQDDLGMTCQSHSQFLLRHSQVLLHHSQFLPRHSWGIPRALPGHSWFPRQSQFLRHNPIPKATMMNKKEAGE